MRPRRAEGVLIFLAPLTRGVGGVAFDLCRGRIHATRAFRRHGLHRQPREIRTPRVPAGEGRMYATPTHSSFAW